MVDAYENQSQFSTERNRDDSATDSRGRISVEMRSSAVDESRGVATRHVERRNEDDSDWNSTGADLSGVVPSPGSRSSEPRRRQVADYLDARVRSFHRGLSLPLLRS